MRAEQLSEQPTSCPSLDELVAFSLGRESPTPPETIADHLSSCSACQAVVGGLDRGSDPVLMALRRAPQPEPFLDEPECRQLEALVRGLHVGVAELEVRQPDPVPQAPLPQLGQYQLLAQIG